MKYNRLLITALTKMKKLLYVSFKENYIRLSLLLIIMLNGSCQSRSDKDHNFHIRLITVDPAHFHAALVQKIMYPGIDSVVYVYAPKGLGLQEQLNFNDQYNHRKKNPTHWVEKVYMGNDFIEKMLDEEKGNVVVILDNNKRKTEYIKKSVDAGFNVLTDKPMAINVRDFNLLGQSFADAKKNGMILYDILTQRSEITSILQKQLSQVPEVFGQLKQGTADNPAVIMESVHRFFKQVSEKPLVRPDWYFDPTQQGDAIADVGTHLVDLVQWVCLSR